MRIVIVGGVAGGAGTAARLRRNDESADIILYEKGDYISFANCGLPYYVGGVITDKGKLQLQTPESFCKRFGVDVRVNSEVMAVRPDKHTIEVVNRATGVYTTITYDKLVLSPGGSPICPPLSGLKKERIFTLRNIPDAYRIYDYIERVKPVTCAIIGAGFIGLEMAENLAHRGLKVSVVEAASHVMAPIDLDMAGAVHSKLESMGIGLYLNSRCIAMEEAGVVLEDGTVIDAEMVVMSIGVRPETGFLKNSGIALGERGEILVDEYLRTNMKDIYALGDAAATVNLVTGVRAPIPLAGPANKQARIVADNICGRKVPYEGSLGTSIVRLSDMTVAATGASEETLTRCGIPYRKCITISASHASYYPGETTMNIKLLFSPELGAILGAQIVGFDGVDKRIDSIAAVLRMGGNIYDMQKLELAYAPPFSSAKDPVNMAGYVAENILRGMMKPFYVEDISKLKEDAVFLDVRTPEEYAAGAIPGTRNIPLDELREHLSELNREKTIYITCQIGLRGYLAQRILEQHGFHTFNLSGGYRFYSSCRRELNNP